MKINVLLASNQIRGIDGTGGLGDVPVGLSKALAARGDIDIRLVMPGFTGTVSGGLEDRFDPKNLVVGNLAVPYGTKSQTVNVYKINLPQTSSSPSGSTPVVPCYLLSCPEVFDSGHSNRNGDPHAALFFARAVLEFLSVFEEFRVDLIHCNDWHTGLIPVYVRTLYRDDPYLGRVATLFTTHNAEGGYHGAYDGATDLLAMAGLSAEEVFTDPLKPSLNHFGKFNFCKGGFAFADLINTVSRQYHRELMSPAFGGGLDGLLRARMGDFCGIINGIDVSEWDPEKDGFINPHNFSASDDMTVIRKKKKHLRGLLRNQSAYKNVLDDSTLIAVISRIDYQKTELLQPVMKACNDAWITRQSSVVERILKISRDLQLVILGSPGAGDDRGEAQASGLQQVSKDHPDRVLFMNGFNIPLSHVLYAASDIFVVPSVFEPCGLTQMVAMKYGSVPVVRSVGGLVDTVIDEGDSSLGHLATGFRFRESIDNPNERMHEERAAHALVEAITRAFKLRASNEKRWNELVRNGMRHDWSWQVPSMQYVRLYHEAMRRCVLRFFS